MVPLFMVPAAIGVAGMLVYAVGLPDQQLHARPGRDWRGVQDADLDDAAKDLGVFNVADVGPQGLAPFVGAALIGGAPRTTRCSAWPPQPLRSSVRWKASRSTRSGDEGSRTLGGQRQTPAGKAHGPFRPSL
jgi:hypothetical protein